MILSGELAFGEQLPPARELAAKMGVSRTVVTAGLVELEKLGFVEIKARQGVYVCDYRAARHDGNARGDHALQRRRAAPERGALPA